MQNIAVFFGGKSVESEVSILSAIDAIANLAVKKYTVYPVYCGPSGHFEYLPDLSIACLKNGIKGGKRCTFLPSDSSLYLFVRGNKLKQVAKIDCILNVCHGGFGENGGLCGLLEASGIPYTSCGILPACIGMDKHIFKLLLEALEIPTLPHIYIKCLDELDEQAFEFPVIVKPANLGSSIGISKASDKDSLRFAVSVALLYDCGVVIEPLLNGFTEINCAAICNGNKVILSALEQPIYSTDFLSFSDKYLTGEKMTGQAQAKRIFPAILPKEQKDMILHYTKRIYSELEYGGVIRVDYLIVKDNIYINEINTIPGALSNYLFGFSYSALLDILIENAHYKQNIKNAKIYQFDSGILSCYDSAKFIK